jgi:hypothetical protein
MWEEEERKREPFLMPSCSLFPTDTGLVNWWWRRGAQKRVAEQLDEEADGFRRALLTPGERVLEDMEGNVGASIESGSCGPLGKAKAAAYASLVAPALQ